jgi:hypothetical protein
MLGAFVGALLVLGLTTAFSWHLTPTAHAGDQAAAFDAPAGSCLTWNKPRAADIHLVSCSRPHRFEVTGRLKLAKGSSAPMPTHRQWQQIAQRKCVPPAERYLGGKLDPQGKYSVGVLMPSAQQWADGDRTLRCGLQVAASSGKLLTSTGTVRSADQSAVKPPGTCLGLRDKAVGDPVSCDEPHSYEIVGIVDLAKKLGPDFPSKDEQKQALVDACRTELKDYANGVDLDKYGLTLTWDTRSKRSWRAGSTRVNCKVGALLADGSGLKPVTGSIKR